MTLLAAMLLPAACSDDKADYNELTMPEGTGRISLCISTSELPSGHTRAVNTETTWLDPDHDWEKLQSVRIFICNAANNQVVQIIEKTRSQLEVASTPAVPDSTLTEFKPIVSEPLPTTISYSIYATANFHSSPSDDNNYAYSDGITVGSTLNPNATFSFTNGYSEKNIPMTGRLNNANGTLKTVTVSDNTITKAGTLSLWRVMGKLQFYFTNESAQPVRIKGVEVYPINQATVANGGVYLFSKDNLASEENLAAGTGITLPAGARTDVGVVTFEPTNPVMLAAKNDNDDTDEGTFFFYVNETDATFTVTRNQLSLRFKVQRLKEGGSEENEDDWYDEEIRHGVTTHYGNGSVGQNGFNVIRRNDWIHIPVVLTDWQLRIEPLAFVPIAGYPAKTLSSDGLTATFSTGGMIALQPFIKKYTDKTWRSFGDPEITFGNEVKVSDKVDDEESWKASVTWKNADGDNSPFGAGNIVTTPFRYDPVTNSIIGELNNNLAAGNYTDNDLSVYTKNGHKCFKTTFTVCLRLGPQDDSTKQYVYTFTFNVILER
jgi:hypothetical protein